MYVDEDNFAGEESGVTVEEMQAKANVMKNKGKKRKRRNSYNTDRALLHL